MMTELDKTAALVRGMITAVKIPVTAKMRLGWDEQNLTAPELARALEDAGVAAVFVHGRTRAQGFAGQVNLAGIRAVVEAVQRIPVIGNGDVTTPEAAQHMIATTGCTGVSIGRGAFYDPWIFRRTDHLLRTGKLLPEPGFEERIRVLRIHFERYLEFYGEETGPRLFRRVAPWYARRFGPSKPFKQAILGITSRVDFEQTIADYVVWRGRFCDEHGELRAQFKPDPLVASFMRDPDDPVFAREAIPVPKGPVENW
jgi:nifR3 family TIM-barrel protein